jgi:hypothetical protein
MRLPSALATALLTAASLTGALMAVPAAGAASHQGEFSGSAHAATEAFGSWQLTGSMISPHGHIAMTMLKDGRILAVSGDGGGFATAVSETYNPATGTWTQTGNVNQPREDFGLVTLNNGKALITGGTDSTASTDYAATEIYNPATGRWRTTGALNTPRRNPVVVALSNGEVLAATGAHGPPDGNRFLFTAELYNPATRHWTYTGNMDVGRDGDSRGAVLHDGRVLLLGGEGPWLTFSPATDVYDPAVGMWSRGGDLPGGGIAAPTLTVLANGQVLLAGGYDFSGTTHAEAYLFDPATEAWTQTGSMNYARSSASSVLLPDGEVLVAGGGNGAGPVLPSEIYNPATGQWRVGPALKDGHIGGKMILLSTGEILMAGGYDANGPTTAAELLGAPAPSWWSGACDVTGHAGSYPLGASYDGVPACGPGTFQGGYNQTVNFYPGAYPVLEWQCVELVMRYMYLVYGVPPYSANGSTVVSNYTGTALTQIPNTGSSLPSPGDVISEGAATSNGHTGVVTAVHVTNGSGTVTMMEENASPGGYATIHVSGDTLGSGVTGWLTPATSG